VVVPDASRVGEVNGGWAATMTTLTSERTLISSIIGDRFELVAALARRTGAGADPVRRQELARCYIGFELVKYLGWRQMTALSRGRPAGPESSLAKLALSQQLGASGDLIMALQGPAATVSADDPRDRYLSGQFLGQWSSRFGGGTEQIQRNIIGERLLGLPRDPEPVPSTRS
jgi:alkylation response protein AidB-like acyl-CoA dehydrogenase